MKQQKEFILKHSVCSYLERVYPDVLFLTDTIGDLRLTIPQALRNKSVQKKGFKCPDLLILEPRGGYSGLLIEFKIESIYKKGKVHLKENLLKNSHLLAQYDSIEKLNKKGYCCVFCWEYETAIHLIQNYLNFPLVVSGLKK